MIFLVKEYIVYFVGRNKEESMMLFLVVFFCMYII